MIDIGANLTDASFASDLEAVLNRARDVGVEQIIVTGTSVEGSREALAIARRYPALLSSTAGVHPHEAGSQSDAWLATIEAIAADPKVVALGEMGLDYFRSFSEPAAQRSVFAAQLELAQSVGKPVFVHDRDTEGDVLRHLVRHRPPACVVHCFTGTERDLDAYLAEGFHIGITGWVCDERRGTALRSLVPRIPEDRLLVETDAPYLLPRTIRPRPKSRRNEPALLTWIIDEIANLRGVTPRELAATTAANARRLFGLGSK